MVLRMRGKHELYAPTEDVQPVGDILPNGAKLLEVISTGSVAVKYANHHLNRFRIERLPCTVRQRLQNR